MSGFLISAWGVGLLLFFLVMVFLAVACAMGVVDFRWKQPKLPISQSPRRASPLGEVRAFALEAFGEAVLVHYVDEAFHISLPEDFTMEDDAVIERFTAAFPRDVFAVRREVTAES